MVWRILRVLASPPMTRNTVLLPDDASPQAVLYAYIHPRPDGCATARIEPAAAGWVEAMGEWVLPYDEVRASMDPAAVVSEFLRSAYRAAVDLGGWDEKAQRYERPKSA